MSSYATPAKFNELIIFKLVDGEMQSKKIPDTDWYYWAGQGWKGTEALAKDAVEQPKSEVQAQCDRALAAFLEYKEAMTALNETIALVDSNNTAEQHWASTLQGLVMAATTLSPEGTLEAVKQVFG